uniref:C2 n=1 Tax=Solanum tuberosum TaxID=4113 RepID=M1B7F6_SOLTU
MGDKLGQIKVTVIKGRRLVIRDFKTSDPYVILKLGNQTAKTKVINSCLNPVWNEEFCFSISEPAEVLKLVFAFTSKLLFHHLSCSSSTLQF